MKKYLLTIIFIFTLSCTSAYAMDPVILQFGPDMKEIQFGKINDDILAFQYSFITGSLSDYNLKVLDSNGNEIMQGFEGKIPVSNTSFPIKFVLETASTDFEFRLRIYGEQDTAKEISNKLDTSNSLLDNIRDKLAGIKSTLDKIDSLLNDSQALTGAMNNLSNSIDRLNNYSPITTAKDGASKLENLKVDGSTEVLPSIEITFAPGITRNIFDLSQWGWIIPTIRALMVAVLYISLFIYLIQVLIPRLKV